MTDPARSGATTSNLAHRNANVHNAELSGRRVRLCARTSLKRYIRERGQREARGQSITSTQHVRTLRRKSPPAAS